MAEQQQYWTEIGDHWRPLLAATMGIGCGMSLAGPVTTTVLPHLLKGNGWSPAYFAFVGSLGLLSSIAFPFIGRMADVLGVRWTAMIGQILVPITWFAYSRINGDLSQYIAIFIVQGTLGITTTATVYSRLAVEYVKSARGLALAIVVSGQAIVSILGAPLLNAYVEANDWRAAYVAVAIFAAVAGFLTFLLIPPHRKPDGTVPPKRKARLDYPVIFRAPAFWVLAVAMLLCNLPQTLLLVQLKRLVMANGISGPDAGWMLAAVPFGQLAGRFVAGLALDRARPHLVAFVLMLLPSAGLFIVASNLSGVPILSFAVFCMGFAFGAEGDIVAFLVARYFGVQIYGSVMGLMTSIISVSTSSGAIILGTMMEARDSYDPFLLLTGSSVVAGAFLLLLLGRVKTAVVEDDGLSKVFS